MVRDFRGVLEREHAEMGLFICLRAPSDAVKKEAASAGLAKTVHGDIPRLQIVAIEEWFRGKLPKLPPLEHLPSAAFSTARRRSTTAPRPSPDQPQLPLPIAGGKAAPARHLNPIMVTLSGVGDDAQKPAA
jgi:site-specific DNA-methyltransferase (adenine-specific)